MTEEYGVSKGGAVWKEENLEEGGFEGIDYKLAFGHLSFHPFPNVMFFKLHHVLIPAVCCYFGNRNQKLNYKLKIKLHLFSVEKRCYHYPHGKHGYLSMHLIL